MRIESSSANPGSSPVASAGEQPTTRRDTLVMVRWALALACAYLVLFSEGSAGTRGLGALVIVVFLASNLVVGRLAASAVGTPQFSLTIAALDTLLIGASLYSAGQVSVELVVLFLGVLVLAISGFRLGTIAAVTLAITFASLVMVWVGGNQPLWRSSMLLRIPFLLAAAVVYAWLVEAGRSTVPTTVYTSLLGLDELSHHLLSQRDAILRCQAGLAEGASSAAQTALRDVAERNQEMATVVAQLQRQETDTRPPLAVARSAA